MRLVRDFEQHKMYLIDNNKVLVEFFFLADEYVMVFYTKDRVAVTEDVNKDFYEMYNEVLSNSYIMNIPYSYQSNNRIMWFSDEYCNLGDNWETSVKNRFCLEKEDNTIYFSAKNPFFDKQDILKYPRVVIFSPAGNGHYAINRKTNAYFQDDIIMIHQKMLEDKKQKIKRRME